MRPREKILGTYKFSQIKGVRLSKVRSLILRRRLQILVHSCLYYRLDTSLIPDKLWQTWSQELVELQNKYPQIAERVQYHKAFKDFDGNTGYHLPITNPEIMEKALQLKRVNHLQK